MLMMARASSCSIREPAPDACSRPTSSRWDTSADTFSTTCRKLVVHRLDARAGALVGNPIAIGEAASQGVHTSDLLLSWASLGVSVGAYEVTAPLVWVDRPAAAWRSREDRGPDGDDARAAR